MPVDSGGSLTLTSPVGSSTPVKQRDRRSTCGNSLIDSSVTLARFEIDGRRSLTRPCSSAGETSARVCAIHGNDAATVAGVSRTPGRISREKARSGGDEWVRGGGGVFAFSSTSGGRGGGGGSAGARAADAAP